MAASQQARLLGLGSCALAGILWGCSFLVGKIALAEVDFAHMILWRFLFASIALTPILVKLRPKLTRKEWTWLTIASFFGIPMQFLIQFYGLSLTSVSHSSLMVGTMPVLLAVAAAVFAHERMDALGWTAIAASTIGAGLIALSGRSHAVSGYSLTGDLLIVLSMVMALVWILLNKKLTERHSVVLITVYGIVQGTIMLLIWVPLRYGMPHISGVSEKAWLAILASGLLCTAAPKFLWNWGISRVPASQAGMLLNLQPLVGCILGILILHDSLTLGAWAGGAMILVATVVVTARSRTSVAGSESATTQAASDSKAVCS
jgi:drug/metabolite transporter (DMT)-like permease